MLVYAKTDIGKAREMNQDFIYVSQNQNNMQLCILADGMGGYKGGEIASKLATISAKQYIENNIGNIDLEYESLLNLIKKAMEFANLEVHNKATQIEELELMGTTLEICLIIRKQNVYRAYR